MRRLFSERGDHEDQVNALKKDEEVENLIKGILLTMTKSLNVVEDFLINANLQSDCIDFSQLLSFPANFYVTNSTNR